MGYQSLEDWIAEDNAGCCPDPEAMVSLEELAEQERAADPYAFDVVTDHGYEPRTTPVDTLMAGPVQMHFDFAASLED